MRICGLKVTHDGAIALVEDGRLIFSVEQEKLGNNRRYQPIRELDVVSQTLAQFGYRLDDIDQFVVDGWDGDQHSKIPLLSSGQPITLCAAPYIEASGRNVMEPLTGAGLVMDGQKFEFVSYPHVAGHISSAYCTSDFAKQGLSAYCLVWDGSIFPRLYFVDPEVGSVTLVKSLFPLIGHAYAAAGQHFGPYKRDTYSPRATDLGVAGKLMAYIAMGSARDDIVAILERLYQERFSSESEAARLYREQVVGAGMGLEPSLPYLHEYMRACAQALAEEDDDDVLTSFHVFLERKLVSHLVAAVEEHAPDLPKRICVVGGCALNIKWNSAIRETGRFEEVWVPPFPNDSGSAIGAACCGMISAVGLQPLEWSVYSGPALVASQAPQEGWRSAPCDLPELARRLIDGAPVVFLTGRAELGPRALGSRSILASPVSPHMKDLLNDLKLRERFRPVAPICLADRAPELFEPGLPDPYMLFDHQTRPDWLDRIPAVVHLDGTARLQTVGRDLDHPVARLLIEFERLTGLPVLCNTSANHHGRGFFPDVASACAWGKIAQVWSDGVLYSMEVPETSAHGTVEREQA